MHFSGFPLHPLPSHEKKLQGCIQRIPSSVFSRLKGSGHPLATFPWPLCLSELSSSSHSRWLRHTGEVEEVGQGQGGGWVRGFKNREAKELSLLGELGWLSCPPLLPESGLSCGFGSMEKVLLGTTDKQELICSAFGSKVFNCGGHVLYPTVRSMTPVAETHLISQGNR